MCECEYVFKRTQCGLDVKDVLLIRKRRQRRKRKPDNATLNYMIIIEGIE